MEMEYASKGVAGSGLGLGIAGTALGLLNGAGGLASMFGNAGRNYAVPVACGAPVGAVAYSGGCCSENTPVTRYEVGLEQKIAEKEAHIRLLEADKYTDQKIVEATTYLQGQIKELAGEVRANKETQDAVNLNQAVLNGTTNAVIGCIKGQVDSLLGLTKLVVPNSSVCPGYGNVTITPAGAATT